jgi:hypothetical protein
MPQPFNFGDLGLHPVTSDWGLSRGRPVDRPYIESFLERHRDDIAGHVVEIGGRGYTTRFGATRVHRSDVWDVDAADGATIVADVSHAPQVASNTFDCLSCRRPWSSS